MRSWVSCIAYIALTLVPTVTAVEWQFLRTERSFTVTAHGPSPEQGEATAFASGGTTAEASASRWEVWPGLVMASIAGASTVLGATVVLFMPEGGPPPSAMAFAFSLAAGVMVAISAEMLWPHYHEGEHEVEFSARPFLVFSCGAISCALLCKLGDWLGWAAPGETVAADENAGADDNAAADDKGRWDVCGCGTAFPENSKFCRKCGAKRPEPAEVTPQVTPQEVPSEVVTCCGSCGAVFSATAKFCNACGEKRPEEIEQADSSAQYDPKSFRLAALLFISLTLHNFPEGFAVAVASASGMRLGVTMCIAVAFHNIPEGIALAVSVHRATKSVGKSFLWTFLSGLTEPLGALCAMLLLKAYMSTPEFLNDLLTAVAGVMCYVALAELLPEAVSTRCWASIGFGFCLGVAVMVLTHWVMDSTIDDSGHLIS